MGNDLATALNDPGKSPLVRMSTMLFSRDPTTALAKMDAMGDANQERAQKNSTMDALARLQPGILDSKGISWDKPPMPTGTVQNQLPGAPSMDEQGNISPGKPWSTTPFQSIPQFKQDMGDQQDLVNKAFPMDAAARLKASVLPAPPVFDKLDPGATAGTRDAHGIFTPTYTAPMKPTEAKVVTLSKDGQTKTLNVSDPLDQARFAALTGSGWNEVKTPAAAVTITNTGDKAVTGVDAKRYEATTQALQTLDQMQPFMDRMAEAAADGAQTGFGQDWMLKAKQAVGSLTGEVPKGTSEQEVFQAAQNYLGPRMRVTGSGSSSDRDVALFLDSIPSLTKTGAGNQALQDMYAKIRNRTAQVAGIQQDLLRQNNYIPVDQERKLVAALGPLFTDDDRKVIKAAKSAVPAPAAAGAPAPPANAPPTAKPAPDGNWYSPDPDRPGKYLKW